MNALMIAPYEGLGHVFKQIAHQQGWTVQIETGDLEKGVAMAKQRERTGSYDVIISRGATARLLKKHCQTPVIEMSITGYDILRTLTLLKDYPEKIGIMSFYNTVQGADKISELLDITIATFLIHEEKDIEAAISQAAEEGINIIVGDVITTEKAAAAGMRSLLITSGEEAVLETLEQARQLVESLEKLKERCAFFQQIIEQMPSSLMLVDENEEPLYMNEKARQLAGLKEKDIASLLSSLKHTDLHHSRMEWDGEIYAVRQTKQDGQRLFQIDSKQSIEAAEAAVRKDALDTGSATHFSHVVSTSSKMKQLLTLLAARSREEKPVFLVGEAGTGKTTLAQAIHTESRASFPFVRCHCHLYEEAELEAALFKAGGLLDRARGGTLLLEEITEAPEWIIKKIMLTLHNTRLIGTTIQQNEKLERLVELTEAFSVHIPPLRERTEDIKELVFWFISENNIAYGKQIAGIRPKALEQLERLSWTYNVKQLKETIEQICIQSTESFIQKEVVESVLLPVQQSSEKQVLSIEGKTLSEIERDAIQLILIEENYNQSKAAKRLGIDRSTLWRKIKAYSL